MENKINKIIELANGVEYFVMKQAIYKGESYYIVAEVTPDGEDLQEKFAVLHATIYEGKESVEFVDDPTILKTVLEHVEL